MRRRAAVYSSSGRRAAPAADAVPAADAQAPRKRRLRRPRRLAAFVLAGLALVLAGWALAPAPGGLSLQDVDAAIERALEERERPSAADAYEVISPSVVLVHGLPDAGEGELEGIVVEANVGTGVVIVDSGVILTNLHVVQGASRLRVTFSDGTESDAALIGARPEHDLAVLQARTLPDDLVPATMRSTADLQPGDEVVAVGFPFGVGPSASAGVISGLRREYVSPSGGKLTNLIQFDAAVNPGNSGGPLVTTDGEVVGIVTGLLNPTESRVFIGIGFAVPIENAAGAAGLSPF
ncbi:MAG: trypsin-like peptidase domain-containing protein [Betaproteobacteria bacterium]|nr:trypsin-like peptidase domain-containing protein [Betaproteobacteria bacterium]